MSLQLGLGISRNANRDVIHLLAISQEIAETILKAPQQSLRLAKRCIDRGVELDPKGALEAEIAAIEDGRLDAADNALKHAPHTAEAVVTSDWTHAYTREHAAFPLAWVKDSKYWPPVSRIDNVHGDRHIFCSCPPMASA